MAQASGYAGFKEEAEVLLSECAQPSHNLNRENGLRTRGRLPVEGRVRCSGKERPFCCIWGGVWE